MTKLFGEYLVEKGYLSESALLTALIQQLKTIPSITELVFEKKIMHHDQILNILLLQHHKKSGFIESAKELNLWTSAIQNEVENEISRVKIPLGEVLVRSGVVSLEVIAEALDCFLTETKLQPEGEKKSITDTCNESLRKENQIQASSESQIKTYFEQFTLEKYLELKVLLTLSHHNPLTQEVITKAMKNLQEYKNIVSLAILPKSELVIENMLKSLEELILRNDTSLTPDEMTRIENYELSAFEVLWQIREELENKKSEDQIVQEFTLTSALDKIIKGVILK